MHWLIKFNGEHNGLIIWRQCWTSLLLIIMISERQHSQLSHLEFVMLRYHNAIPVLFIFWYPFKVKHTFILMKQNKSGEGWINLIVDMVHLQWVLLIYDHLPWWCIFVVLMVANLYDYLFKKDEMVLPIQRMWIGCNRQD